MPCVEVIGLKKLVVLLFATVVAMSACGSMKNVVVKDIPLQEQEAVLDKYKDRHVWTRVTINDLGDGGSIPRDEEVVVVDVAMHYKGSVTVQTMKKKNRIVQGLEIERPLNTEKIDKRMAELFWFDDPTIRHVNFIRKYDKKTAQAIMDHELVKGMSAEAAADSWGPPVTKEIKEMENKVSEKWVYPTDTPKKTKNLYIENGKVVRWDE